MNIDLSFKIPVHRVAVCQSVLLLACCLAIQPQLAQGQAIASADAESHQAVPSSNKGKKNSINTYPNLSGLWYWEGRPLNESGVIRNGNIAIYLEQSELDLSGQLVQINSPLRDYDYHARPATGPLTEYDALVDGKIYGTETSSGKSLFFLRRLQQDGKHQALFTGTISSDTAHIDGWFVNTWGEVGGRGIFVMRRVQEAPDQSSLSTEANPETERGKILKMARQFERAIQQKDSLALEALYLTPETPVSNLNKGQLQSRSAQAFVTSLTQRKDSVAETLHKVTVNVDGLIGTLTAEYHWSVNGTLKDRGKAVWLLAKVEDEWRIIHHLWGPSPK